MILLKAARFGLLPSDIGNLSSHELALVCEGRRIAEEELAKRIADEVGKLFGSGSSKSISDMQAHYKHVAEKRDAKAAKAAEAFHDAHELDFDGLLEDLEDLAGDDEPVPAEVIQ